MHAVTPKREYKQIGEKKKKNELFSHFWNFFNGSHRTACNGKAVQSNQVLPFTGVKQEVQAGVNAKALT